MNKTLKLTNIAMLMTFAVVIHFVENLIPLPLPVPGVKIGLANIITILTLTIYGFGSGMLVAVGRSVLGSFFTGSFLGFGFWLSFSAAATSCVAMALVMPLREKGYFTLVSVSIIGAVVHNITQLTIASVIMQNIILLQGYLPLLIILAVPTGLLTGLAAQYLENITRKNLKMIKG